MNDTSLKNLRAIMRHVLTSPRSSFYRDFYVAKNLRIPGGFPHDTTEWTTLPFLTKKDLMDTPFEKRLFVPFEKAGAVRCTSGTSGRGVLLFPRNEPSFRPEMEGACSRMLMFYYPLSPLDEWGRPIGIGSISPTPGNIAATARSAALFQIDGISGPPNAIVALIPHLREVYDTSLVRYIIFMGGFASPSQFAEMDRAFPNARITWEYASIEGNGKLARACEEMESVRGNHLHFDETRCYPEIIDPDTQEPIHDAETEGELVITTTWTTNALPVIRYRTGDLAKWCEKKCACSYARSLVQVLGRVEFDRASIPGGQLHSGELDRVLLPFSHVIHSDYELHVYDSARDAPRIVLRIRPRSHMFDHRPILEAVARNMRIGPSRVLSDAINAQLLRPLECDLIREEQGSGRRLTRIRKHEGG